MMLCIVAEVEAVGQRCISFDRSCHEEARETQERSVSIVVIKIQMVEFLHKDAHIFAITTDRGVNRRPFRIENIGLSVGKTAEKLRDQLESMRGFQAAAGLGNAVLPIVASPSCI